MTTVILLICSNVFMTMAWYGHLKYKQHALWIVVWPAGSSLSRSTCSRFPPTGSDTGISARRS